METVFDFSPTVKEVNETAFNYLDMRLRCGDWNNNPTKDWYQKNVKPDWAIFDIAILFEGRGETETAQTYFDKIPAIAGEYQRGKDFELIPS